MAYGIYCFIMYQYSMIMSNKFSSSLVDIKLHSAVVLKLLFGLANSEQCSSCRKLRTRLSIKIVMYHVLYEITRVGETRD